MASSKSRIAFSVSPLLYSSFASSFSFSAFSCYDNLDRSYLHRSRSQQGLPPPLLPLLVAVPLTPRGLGLGRVPLLLMMAPLYNLFKFNSMNKYEILGIVGEGAYGVVYKAKNKESGDFGNLIT